MTPKSYNCVTDRARRLAFGATALLCLLSGALSVPSVRAAEYIRGTLIVKLAPAFDTKGIPVTVAPGRSGRADFDRVTARFKAADLRQLFPPRIVPSRLQSAARAARLTDFVIVRVPAGVDPESLRREFAASPDVESVEYDVVVHACGTSVTPNDPYFSTHQYGPRNTGAQPPYDPGTSGADAEMEAAWAITTGDTDVVLAIIDTGVDIEHPEFVGRIWRNPNEEFDDFDNDANGYVDDVFGYNFIDSNNANMDNNGHGTHCAGIAAATGNNGVGIAGMDWRCRIMALKVLGGDGSGSVASVSQGIEYAASMGADVISMSLGYQSATGGAAVESVAVAYALAAGVTVVAAMGNENRSDADSLHYPSAYPSVIAVGATDSDDRRAHPFCYWWTSGSNYGSYIDVCAAGDNVWSTLPVYRGSYGNMCGTSMATPQVAGLACLVKASRPDWSPDSVAWLIRQGAEDQVGRPEEDTPGFDVYHGWGRINGRITLQALAVPFPPMLSLPGSQSVTEADTLSFTFSVSDSNFTTDALSMVPLENAQVIDHGDGTAELIFVPDYDQQGVRDLALIASDGALADTEIVAVTVLDGCRCACHADPICDSVIDIRDVVSTVTVAFRSGAVLSDVDCPTNPGGRTDINCDSVTTILDVVHVVGVAFRNETPAFCDPCAP